MTETPKHSVRAARIAEYQRGSEGKDKFQGENSAKNLKAWSERASEHSEMNRRPTGRTATNGACEPNLDPPRLPANGGHPVLRDTSAEPRSAPHRARRATD